MAPLHRSHSRFGTEFWYSFPFLKSYSLESAGLYFFFSYLAASLFLSLINTYCVTTKAFSQTLYTFLQFCISVIPKVFYSYNIYYWATFIHLIIFWGKNTHILSLYMQFSTTLFPWDTDVVEVHNTWEVPHFRAVSPGWPTGVVPSLGIGGGSLPISLPNKVTWQRKKIILMLIKFLTPIQLSPWVLRLLQ